LGREPINFLTYDKSDTQSLAKSEKEIQPTGMLDLIRKQQDLRRLVLFDVKTKKVLLKIDYQEDTKTIESKIKNLLKR